jgi:hypothetical protein
MGRTPTEKLRKLVHPDKKPMVDTAVSTPLAVSHSSRYLRKVARIARSPETFSCSRSKTFWTCLSVRLVFVARSNSSAILSAFLLSVSFVEIRRCLPF